MSHPEPLEIITGDTLSWLRSCSDVTYVDHDGQTQECKASDGWTLKYSFAAPVALGAFQITAAAHDTDDYLVSVSAATTSGYAASDNYAWVAYVEKGAGASLERHQIDSGSCKVKAGHAYYQSRYDRRSHCKKVLDAIEALIEGRATADVSQYSIAGRSIVKMAPEELLRWRSFYKTEYQAELDAEKIAGGLATGRKIMVRFPEY